MMNGKKESVAKMKTREYSLYDLDIINHTQINYGEIIIPLKMDISLITEYDYILAVSFMNKYKRNKIDEQDKTIDELEDIKIVTISNKGFLLDYSPLEKQEDIDYLEFENRFDMLLKFINNDNIYDNNSKNFKEYYGIEDIKKWMYDTEANEEFYFNFSSTIYFWIDKIVSEFRYRTKLALELDPKNEKNTTLNMSMQTLKACITQLHIPYFEENQGAVAFKNYSLREKHLIGSYNTKMYYIENKINEDAKKQIAPTDTSNNPIKRSSRRGKH